MLTSQPKYIFFKAVSFKQVKKAVEDTERVLYPFIKLLLGMFKGEKDLSLKGNLRNTGNKLNETYDSAVTVSFEHFIYIFINLDRLKT